MHFTRQFTLHKIAAITLVILFIFSMLASTTLLPTASAHTPPIKFQPQLFSTLLPTPQAQVKKSPLTLELLRHLQRQMEQVATDGKISQCLLFIINKVRPMIIAFIQSILGCHISYLKKNNNRWNCNFLTSWFGLLF